MSSWGSGLGDQLFLLFGGGDIEVASPFIPILFDIAENAADENIIFTIESGLTFEWNGTTKQFSMANTSGSSASSEWNVMSRINLILRDNSPQGPVITPATTGRTYFTGDGAIDANQALTTPDDSMQFIVNLTGPSTTLYNLVFEIMRTSTTLSITGFLRTRSI